MQYTSAHRCTSLHIAAHLFNIIEFSKELSETVFNANQFQDDVEMVNFLTNLEVREHQTVASLSTTVNAASIRVLCDLNRLKKEILRINQ